MEMYSHYLLCVTTALSITNNLHGSPIGIHFSNGSVRKSIIQTEFINYTNIHIIDRIEKIKSDILYKLGLDKPPASKLSKNSIPRALFLDSWWNDAGHIQEDFTVDKKKIIIIGRIGIYYYLFYAIISII